MSCLILSIVVRDPDEDEPHVCFHLLATCLCILLNPSLREKAHRGLEMVLCFEHCQAGTSRRQENIFSFFFPFHSAHFQADDRFCAVLNWRSVS